MTDNDIHPQVRELNRRIERAIVRIPDRLSTPEGEVVRADWASTFARVLGGTIAPVRMLGVLPVHPNLWTDPVVIRVFTGYVVLDHPEAVGAFEWAFEQFSPRVAICDCARWWSLYENRRPRLVACPDKGEVVQLSDLMARVGYTWHGPFEARPTLEFAAGSRGPMRSVVQVEHPVADEWFDRI
jgi:hypothetical protein